MKLGKKICALALATVLMAGTVVTASAENSFVIVIEEPDIDLGDLGFKELEDGTLMVGQGSTLKDEIKAKDIVIPDNVDGKKVTWIGANAFNSLTTIKSVVIPDTITNIGSFAFMGCTNLESVTIPGSVTSVGQLAFFGCTGLESVTIVDGVTKIDMATFKGCTNLKSIVIPDSVVSITKGAFADCNSLTDVYYSGSKEQWEKIDIDWSDSTNVDENGNIIGTAVNSLKNAYIHFSVYETEECGTPDTDSKDSPDTGADGIVLALGVAALAGTAVVIYRKKK